MKVKEAKKILLGAERSSDRSKVNPSFTSSEALDIVYLPISKMKDDDTLHPILEKRVYQVTRNQRRPRF